MRNEFLKFQAPSLQLPEGLKGDRLGRRLHLLQLVEKQRRDLDREAASQSLDRFRADAVSLLTGRRVQEAFDVVNAPAELQERYGRNSFGWSLLMARRLIEAGVSMIQVNLGTNESWDTHGFIFRLLGNFLLPPLDRALSALLDDLHDSGLLDSTLIVMAGGFGRTPQLSGSVNAVGRDHWGALQSVFFAGGGVRGGCVVGASDKFGAYPVTDPQTPENMAATIYSALGIPRTFELHDQLDRPHQVYHGQPIPGLA